MLCHAPLLTAVLGHSVEVQPATLPDHAVVAAGPFDAPALVQRPGMSAPGLLAEALSDADIGRLDFHQACWGAFPQERMVLAERPVAARTWSGSASGPDWDMDRWVARWAATATATTGDIMALYGERGPDEIRPRLSLMMVRGASRLRAPGGPAALRHDAVDGGVRVRQRRQPYAHFFAVEEYDLSYRRFDGRPSADVNRAVFVSGDAVTVLPYDPVRDRVLLIEQFRVGPFARGDDQPWLLEPIAGRIDPGETPEAAGRREAVEEAGLTLGSFLKVADYYPSPGAKAEFLYSFVALADLPDGIAGTFGLPSEAEDIRGHLVTFDALMRLVQTGEAANGPLVLTALWLERERARLRA